MPSPRHMRIGMYATATGGHVAGWRHPDARAEIGADPAAAIEMAQMAESALLDFIFLADSMVMRGHDWEVLSRNSTRYVAQFEPVTLLSALSAVTRHIGLVATNNTTYDEPYAVARRFASLDLLSGGRAGWNVVTSSNEEEALNFSRDRHPDHAARYERANEFVDVVAGLWRTWEPDSFPRDKDSGRFFDPAKMHLLNHAGPHFQVRGPLNVPLSPQGRPLIVQAGGSEPGRDMAARTAEVIFALHNSIEVAREFYADMKRRLPGHGRGTDDMLILPGVTVFVGESEAEAREKQAQLRELVDPVVGRDFLEHQLGDVIRLADYSDDEPLPDLPESNANRSSQARLVKMARDEGLTIRELYLRLATKSALEMAGTPVQIADRMQEWFEGGAADGFIFLPDYFPNSLAEFRDQVVPELQRRGLFRTEYASTTLRGNLGLPPA